jgi:L-seryl-tRNA(Ser) seleniumtransferase
MLLKVHPSNYRVEGFTEEASVSELAQLARRVEVPFVVDVGSGLLDQETPWLTEHPPAWLAGEPGVRQTLKAGADLVLFSGDKLLGGPQAGMIVGREDLITRLVASPIARALRQDGVALAGLASTLEAYADRRVMEIPLWKMAAVSYDSLERRAMRVVDDAAVDASVVAGVSAMGGGTVPGMEIPSPVIELHGPADQVFAALLAHTPTVLARRVRGKVLVDLRAVEPEDDHILAKAISGACQ